MWRNVSSNGPCNDSFRRVRIDSSSAEFLRAEFQHPSKPQIRRFHRRSAIFLPRIQEFACRKQPAFCGRAPRLKPSARHENDMKGQPKIERRLSAILKVKHAALSPASARKDRDIRREARRNTYQAAKVILRDATTEPCIVRDISAKGARILIQCAEGLPTIITLVNGSLGYRNSARIVWRAPGEAGLEWTLK